MAPRLKVFIMSDGLTDYVVAVSSKAKALTAWDVRQDLFAEGAAREVDDPGLVKAALAQPGKVLRRPAGSSGPPARFKPAKPVPASGPTKVQLKRISDLEAKLAALDATHDRAAETMERAKADLDRREEALHARHEADRARLETALMAARSAAA